MTDDDCSRLYQTKAAPASGRLAPPAFEGMDQPRAVDLEILGWHAPGRSLDHVVGDLGPELERDLLPHRALEAGQQLAILVAAVPDETLHAGVVVAVVLQDGNARAGKRENQPLV